ncbi:MAG: insulinase family protein [bacterium]|nr:insulinase family protein [bacterium]
MGDFDSAEAKTQVEYWFSDIPKRHVCNKIHSTASPEFSSIVKKTIYDPDDKPHRTLYWHTPAIAQEGDDALHILSNLFNLNSARIQQRVTRNKRMVSEIVVCQDSKELGSVFAIEFYPLPGYSMDEIQKIVDEEIERIAVEPPSQQEVDMAVAALEFQSVVHSGRLENYAEELNHSYLFRGKAIEPAAALERYRRLTPEDISACAKRYLCPGKRLEITVLPEPVPAGHNAVRH